jgi:hypothetical protein
LSLHAVEAAVVAAVESKKRGIFSFRPTRTFRLRLNPSSPRLHGGLQVGMGGMAESEGGS